MLGQSHLSTLRLPFCQTCHFNHYIHHMLTRSSHPNLLFAFKMHSVCIQCKNIIHNCLPIMLTLCLMFLPYYYSQYYTEIIGWSVLHCVSPVHYNEREGTMHQQCHATLQKTMPVSFCCKLADLLCM